MVVSKHVFALLIKVSYYSCVIYHNNGIRESFNDYLLQFYCFLAHYFKAIFQLLGRLRSAIDCAP
jgi:hypothetical protein